MTRRTDQAVASPSKRFWLSAVAAFLLLNSLVSLAQTPLTGTRIQGAGSSNPRTSIQMGEPEEVVRIRNLLARGETERALALAHRYVRQAETGALDAHGRYYAHNSLCVAHTYARELEQAIAECTKATEVMPGDWSAWNNRGTAHYLTGDLDSARADYRRALQAAGEREGVVDLLRHNLRLVDIQQPQAPR